MRVREALIATALVALSATVALAQGGGGMMPRGPGRRMQMLFNGITLTSQQQAKVDSIEGVYQPQMRALFTPGERPDSASREKMTALRDRENKDLRAVLTPEQAKIFDKNVADMQQRFRGMGGGRGPGM
jgi:periplasmic protein CpxP/Spy